MLTTNLAASLIVIVASICIPFNCNDALARDVKVEVMPGSIVSDRVPRVFAYGGNIWWIPSIFGAGVAQRVLRMPNPGITRISLGDQILTHATSREDLQRRLADYPLNNFLTQYAKVGGKVLFILDGVPVWASSNKSTRTFPDPDQKIFRMSPPADFHEWAWVVETIVRHFNGRLGIKAYYEAWNEPNWYYLGTTEQFHKQYLHSVLGARRADPAAMIGGPGISEFLGVGTRGDSIGSVADKNEMTKRFFEQRFAFKQFLEFAGKTSVPELGLKRLPVDFFSWHSFYMDPTIYYAQVVPAFRSAISSAGYPSDTPLINSEWNIAPVPPYPEGNINATEVGASFVATSLIAMHEARVDGQIFQMYLDPGVNGYLGGTLTQTGIPRANFNTFRLFSLLKGREIQTRTSDPWVKSTAFRDDANIYLLITTFAPTPKMTNETARINSALQNEQFSKSVAAAQLFEKQGLPEPYAGKAREIAERNQKIVREINDKATEWKKGLTLEIELVGMRSSDGKIRRYLIDSKHSNIYQDLPKAEKFLASRQKVIQQEISELLVTRLAEAGVPKETTESVRVQSANRKSMASILPTVPPAKRDAVLQVVEKLNRDAQNQYSKAIGEIEDWPSARLYEEIINWPALGSLKISSEPYAVHLFVIPQ